MFKKIKNRIPEFYNAIGLIMGYSKNYFPMICIYTLLGLSGTAVTLLSSLVSRDLVDIITGHKSGELIITFCSMLGITLGSTLIGQVSALISTKINLSIENNIKADVFDQIMATKWEPLSRYRSGDLIVRWSSDVSIIANSILSLIPNTIIYFCQFIGALYMVIRYDASFAIFALLGAPVGMFISRFSLRYMQKENMNMMSITSSISSFNQETFGNIQVLKAFDLLPLYSRRLRALQKEYTGMRLKYQKISIVNTMIMTVLSMFVTYSAQAWGIYKVWSGAISYGTMTMFLSLSNMLTGTTNNLISLFPNAISLTNATKRLISIISMPKENFSDRQEICELYERHVEDGIGIHLKEISYAYAGFDNVFEKSTFDANPREVVALVGPSGEGKTTMLRYILSLINSEEGLSYITAGDEEHQLTASVRQLMAYVPQGNTMFSGTIAENMRNVKEDATDEEIINALKLACAWSFVEKLPAGINSYIGERGNGFSEGQAQRLSIARALLRRSPILLLDEATSALDIDTEKQLLQNIMDDTYVRTCIVTTHRPTVLNVCDRVYSIKDKKCCILSPEEVSALTNN